MSKSPDARKFEHAHDARNQLIHVDSAIQGKPYYCLTCKEEMLLRHGDERVKHFSHKSNSDCSGETLEHYRAKHHVAEVLQGWLDDLNPKPNLLMPCAEYHQFSKCEYSISWPLEYDFNRVEVEKKADVGRKPDVSLYKGDQLVLGIEIFVTSRVDQEKARQSWWDWIEISAENAHASSSEWIVDNHNITVWICETCKIAEKQRRMDIKEHVSENGIVLPPPPFRFAMWECPYCGNNLIIFWWDGWYESPEAEPPEWVPNECGKEKYKKYLNAYEYCRFCDCDVPENNLFFGLPALKNYALKGKTLVRIPPHIAAFIPEYDGSFEHGFGKAGIFAELDCARKLFSNLEKYNGFISRHEFESKLLADAQSEAKKQKDWFEAQRESDQCEDT